MLIAPKNNVIVTMSQRMIRGMSDIMRQAQINPSSRLNPADLVNIVGTVVSVPRSIIKRRDYDGFSVKDIKPGDTAVFRYDVVFSYDTNPENGELIFKNEIFYHGKSYWKVDIQKMFCVIRDGKFIMLNGYLMIEGMSKPSNIILPASMRRSISASTATLTHIGRNLVGKKEIDVLPMDTVFFHPLKLQEYQIGDKKFGIIKQKDVFGSTSPIIDTPENN